MSSIYEEHKDEDGFLYITYVQTILLQIINGLLILAQLLGREHLWLSINAGQHSNGLNLPPTLEHMTNHG